MRKGILLILIVGVLFSGCYKARDILHPEEIEVEEEVDFSAMVIMHRGMEGYVENTKEAIVEAFNVAEGCEIDARITSDNKVVVFHDDDTNRLSNENLVIIENTYERLKSVDIQGHKISLLSEILKIIPSNKKLFIEIKNGANEIMQVVADYPFQDRLVFISSDYGSLQIAKNAFPNIECVFLKNQLSDIELEQASLNFESVGSKHYNIDDTLINKCKKNNLKLYAFTLRNKADIDRLKNKIDGILTDIFYS